MTRKKNDATRFKIHSFVNFETGCFYQYCFNKLSYFGFDLLDTLLYRHYNQSA